MPYGRSPKLVKIILSSEFYYKYCKTNYKSYNTLRLIVLGLLVRYIYQGYIYKSRLKIHIYINISLLFGVYVYPVLSYNPKYRGHMQPRIGDRCDPQGASPELEADLRLSTCEYRLLR